MKFSSLSTQTASDQNVYVADCRFGQGLFASRNLKEGTVILEFRGPRIPFSTVLEVDDGRGNPMQIGPDLYIDLEKPSRLGNHSCDPNGGVAEGYWLVARRDIAQDEEIFYDYSTTMLGDDWTMDCDCRTARCRGKVGEFTTLPEAIRQEYLEQGLVFSFIRDGLSKAGN